MLVKYKQLLDAAEAETYAIPAFNVYNMETVMGVIAAAEESRSPVILQAYSRLLDNDEGYYLAPIILAAAEKSTVPVCFHLDHGASEKEVIRALRYGATGIMIDRSLNDFEENVSYTKTIVDICEYAGVGVEGEIGHVGIAANEEEKTIAYTTVEEAKEFSERTGVIALAVAVGTAHGRYKQAPRLAIDRIREIHEAIKPAIVLHGGSGIPDDQIRESVKAGIRKVNFGTDLCYSFIDEIFITSRNKIAVDNFMKGPIDAVKRFALGKMELLSSVGKA